MSNARIAILVVLAGALLLAQGHRVWAAGPNGEEGKHFNAHHRCEYCHTTHRAQGPNNVKDRVLENICRRCHSASEILEWQSNGVLGQPDSPAPFLSGPQSLPGLRPFAPQFKGGMFPWRPSYK